MATRKVRRRATPELPRPTLVPRAPDDVPRSPSGRVPRWVLDESAERATTASVAWRAPPEPVLAKPKLLGRPSVQGAALTHGAEVRRGLVTVVAVSVVATVVMSAVAGRLNVDLVRWVSGGDAARAAALPAAPPAPRPAEPAVDAAAFPLGTPAPVATPSLAYTFRQLQADGATPVAWSPCQPIHYVVREEGGPQHGADMIRSAVARVSVATGLEFVYDGLTDEAPSLLGGPGPDRGDSAPVLIAWATVEEVPALAGSVAALTATALPGRAADGSLVYTGAEIDIDAADVGQVVNGLHGEADVRSILLHELGHLVGLNHVSDSSQLMYPVSSPTVVDFGTGDLTGLAALGRGVCL